MEHSALTQGNPTGCEDAQPDSPAQPPGLQLFAGSHGFKIGSLSATTVGRDLNVQYITAGPGPQVAEAGVGSPTIRGYRETLLGFLEAPSFHDVYANALGQRMAQTGSWFLELPQFQTFMGSRGVTLWCTGVPGAGKTILAAIAIERLGEIIDESEHTSLAFVFLRYSERYAWREVLTSLLAQLVKRSDLACGTFWPFYAREVDKVASKPILLEAILEKALCEISRKLKRRYVVTDGLDESTDEVKDRLLETLVASGCNLLVFSRPLALYTHRASDALFISIQAQTRDIELYVRGEVQRSSRLKSILDGKPDKILELCDKVTKQSEGMFLVARLQMEAITRSSRSISSLFCNLEALPRGVDAMYDHTLGRIRDSEDSSVAFRALAWVAYIEARGFDVFNPPCLQHALSFDTETETFDVDDTTPISLILSACQGLVTVSMGDNELLKTVRFIHYTAYEYLKSVQLDGLPNPRLLLARTCLACLESNREYLLNLRFHDPTGFCLDNDPERPLLMHSIMNWAAYYVRLSQSPSSVFPFIYPYLSKHKVYPLCDTSEQPMLEMVSGAHLMAMYDLTGGFDGDRARTLLTNVKSEPNGFTPFHYAAMRGSFETFKVLLSAYRGANLRSDDGRTVLHFATENNRTSFIRQLYDLTALSQEANTGPEVYEPDWNARTHFGKTPLMIACTRRYDDLSMLLCSLPPVDLGARDDDGNSPLMLACFSGLERVVKFLLDTSDDGVSLVRQTNDCGQTALMAVCHALSHCAPSQETAFLTIFDLLLAHGADFNARDVDGMTPFLCVLGHGERSPSCEYVGYDTDPNWRSPPVVIMERLLALDPTVIDQQDFSGRTALIIASGQSYESSVEWILAHKRDHGDYINVEDEDGLSALVHAFRRAALPVVTALLASPSLRITPRCSRSLSALNWLLQSQHHGDAWDILRMLIKKGGWDSSDIRKVFLSALTVACPGQHQWRIMTAEDFSVLWSLTADSFTWSLEENDTTLLLVLCASAPCRIPVALVLRSLGLLPADAPGEVDFDEDGVKGKCFQYYKYPGDYESHSWDHDFLLSEFY